MKHPSAPNFKNLIGVPQVRILIDDIATQIFEHAAAGIDRRGNLRIDRQPT